jgi:hypothetical protein
MSADEIAAFFETDATAYACDEAVVFTPRDGGDATSLAVRWSGSAVDDEADDAGMRNPDLATALAAQSVLATVERGDELAVTRTSETWTVERADDVAGALWRIELRRSKRTERSRERYRYS